MYDSNKEAAIEFIRGAAVTILVMGVFIGFVLTLGKSDSTPEEKYKVVDHYGTCAVVKYNPPQRAESVYFLDCREVR